MFSYIFSVTIICYRNSFEVIGLITLIFGRVIGHDMLLNMLSHHPDSTIFVGVYENLMFSCIFNIVVLLLKHLL